MVDKGQKAVFPRDVIHGGGQMRIQPGMNLLEHYGGQALVGILASGQRKMVAEAAWSAAKEMVESHPYAS